MPSPVVLATKDPNEVKRYRVDWTRMLESLDSDTISGAATWVYPSGITGGSETQDSYTTTTKLSGGTHGNDYTITVRITTTNGETLEQSFTVPVKDKDK